MSDIQSYINRIIGQITRLNNALMETKNLARRNEIEKYIRCLERALTHYKAGVWHEKQGKKPKK